MIKDRNIDPAAYINPTKIAGLASMQIGETFYIVRAADTALKNWLMQRVPKANIFEAATSGADTAFTKALAACVECRNDYIVVMGSNTDYDFTAAVSVAKKGVHIVCPSGFGYLRGATNSCRIHQNTAATTVFALSDANIEIAGFYIKPYTGVSSMTYAASTYAVNVHHNFFTLSTTTSNEATILCASGSDAGAWGYVAHHNLFESMAGDDQTIGSMISVAAPATGARVDYNDFFVGDGNTYTIVVDNLATKGSVNYNNFMAAGSDATMTHCIRIGDYGSAIGNRGCVGDGAIISGGVNDVTNVDNMNAVNGGAVDDLD